MFLKESYSISLLAIIFSSIVHTHGKWMDSSVSLTIRASQANAFALYSDLNQHPSWSPWLESVKFDRQTGLSEWTLKQFGIRYSWTAHNVICEPPNEICWESLNGLPNKGKVQFEPISQERLTNDAFIMKLTISYDLPHLAAAILQGLGTVGEKFIEMTLLADLKRFQVELERYESDRDSPTHVISATDISPDNTFAGEM